MAAFEVDPDPRRARVLAPAFYRDAACWAAARERIFAPAWHCIGGTDVAAAPGSVVPVELLPGLLDEPLLLARDAAGEPACGGGTLRLLSNVCTHRAMRLVDAPGVRADLRCPYHARSFGLDGRCRGMPGMGGVEGFPGPGDDLPQALLADWGPLRFAALPAPAAAGRAPAAALPFDAWFGPVARRLAFLPWADARPAPGRSRDFTVHAHWALYVENYLEGLHVPVLHPGLAATLDMAGYGYELHPHAALQLAHARPGEACFDGPLAPPPGHPEHGRRIAAWYWWLWPHLMLNVYPWGLSLNLVEPQAPDRTVVRFRSWVWDAARLGQGAGGDLDTVEAEDEAAVEAVQRGVRARLYRPGRIAPQGEVALHHFHRRVAAALAGASGQPASAAG